MDVDVDAKSGRISMLKSKTHFQQVPVEIAKRVAVAEAKRHAADALLRETKKSSNDSGLVKAEPDEGEDA